MADLALNDVIEVTMQGTYQGQRILNVFHYQVSVIAGSPEYNAALASFLTAFRAKMWSAAAMLKDLLTSGYTLDILRAQRVFPNRLWYINQNVDEPGDVAEDGIPSNTAAVITLRSATVGRGTSGSKHFTGFARSTLEPNMWSADLFNSLKGVGDELLEAIITAAPVITYLPVIYNRTDNTSAQLIGHIVAPEVRVMRRRTVGLGV